MRTSDHEPAPGRYAGFTRSRAAVDPARAGLLVAALAVGAIVAMVAVPAAPDGTVVAGAVHRKIWDAPDAETLATIGRLAREAADAGVR